MESERRRFLAATAALGVATLVPVARRAGADDRPKDDKKDEEEEVRPRT
jgi:hypothetical protein